ncbi:MAG: nucleotide exchange factor GrpE [Spirochaetaceae bacterium]|jgi:molecular chaperone GrpE|nr:nucleotide exchange factor GrpE [Spirochaetaceae bacterium]
MSQHTSHEHHSQEKVPPAASGEQDLPVNGDTGAAPGTAETAAATTAAAADNSGAPETSEGVPGPEEQIASLNAALAELNDQYLRKAADFENFRKRMNREKQEAIDFANQNLLLDLIPVIDDFERAMKSAESSRDFDGFYEGIGMIEKQLVSLLEGKWGLTRFDSAGAPFDPSRHEALMMEKNADIKEPTVAEDFLKGFLLKDRVVRSAKVKVLMPEDRAPDKSAGETDEHI